MDTIKLRDGSTVEDPRLDRIDQHDPRNWPVTPLLTAPPERRRGRTWVAGPVLDQGREGACVGFAYAADAAANPAPVSKSDPAELDRLARAIYRRAQTLDPWPETRPGGAEGTSILAGAQAAVEAGLLLEYRWARDVDELARVLPTPMYDSPADGLFGPVIAGVDWRQGMYGTRPDGLVEVSGPIVGGHALLIRGVRFHDPLGQGDPLFVWRNSWGPDYGLNGDGLIRAADLEAILGGQPELCVPVLRRRPDLTI